MMKKRKILSKKWRKRNNNEKKRKNIFKLFNYIFKLFIFILFLVFYIYINNNKNNNNNISNLSQKKSIKLDDSSQGRIFVTFLYNNEAEMAYIHIWRLYDYVDRFIIVTSNLTFTGLPKNVSFSPFEDKIQPYMDKINITYFNNTCNKKEYPSDDLNWCHEKSQRDYGLTFLEENYNLNEKDLIVIVDVDEIFTREGIEYMKKNPPKKYYSVYGAMYFPYYYHKVQNWSCGKVVRYSKNMTTLSNYRGSVKMETTLVYNVTSTKPLITHCSYCFKSLEEYKYKLKAFPHQEFNRPPYITNNWIFKSHYCRVKINSPPGDDEPYEGWKHLIPDDPRLKFIIDPSFMYPLNLTTYTEKDLEGMCGRKYKRTPFE